jgi:hypothetical protein
MDLGGVKRGSALDVLPEDRPGERVCAVFDESPFKSVRACVMADGIDVLRPSVLELLLSRPNVLLPAYGVRRDIDDAAEWLSINHG